MNRPCHIVVLCVVATLLSACTGGPARERGRYLDREDEPAREHVITRDHAITVGAQRDTASLDVVSGVDDLTVTVSDLGDDLARVSTPAGSRIVPVVESEDPVRVAVASGDGSGPAAMTITLNAATRWSLRFSGGSRRLAVDLRGGEVDAVDVAAGVTDIDISLPAPDGVVVVRMGGGATTFDVHAPVDVPVRVRMTGGGGSAVIDGATRTGIPGGAVVEPAGWASAADRYDIDAVAGVSSLTLDRRA